MANALTTAPRMWTLDTAGMLSTRPVCISKIIYLPALAADDLVFKSWNDESTTATGCKVGETATITLTNTITGSGTALPNTIAVGDVFEITYSNGSSANKGVKCAVKTAGNNTVVVVEDNKWTDEAGIVYNWRTFPTFDSLVLKAGASDASAIHVDFGPKGRWFQNLTLRTIDGGTAYVFLM